MTGPLEHVGTARIAARVGSTRQRDIARVVGRFGPSRAVTDSSSRVVVRATGSGGQP